jgi:hypothetical protein
MQYKLGLEVSEKDIRPGKIVYTSFWNPRSIEAAPEGEKYLIEIKSLERPLGPDGGYTFSLLGKDEIHEGDFGLAYFYEAVPA